MNKREKPPNTEKALDLLREAQDRVGAALQADCPLGTLVYATNMSRTGNVIGYSSSEGPGLILRMFGSGKEVFVPAQCVRLCRNGVKIVVEDRNTVRRHIPGRGYA